VKDSERKNNVHQACYFHSHSFPQPTPRPMADSENTSWVYTIQIKMIDTIDISSSLQAKAQKVLSVG